MRIDGRKILKIIIGLKVALLVVVLLVVQGSLHIGDVPLSAQDAKEARSPQSAAVDPTEENDEGEPQAAAPKPAPEPKAKKRSFLASLLDLPPLDTEKIKKEDIARYLELAERKQRQIDDRIKSLTTKETQLTALNDSIRQKLDQLDDERQFFAQTIQREKELQGERLDRLVAVYAKMEPKKAAPVMEQMDKDLVVALWKAIPQKQVMNIVQAMSPEKSVELSEYYGRVRSAREYDLLKEMNKSLLKEFDDKCE